MALDKSSVKQIHDDLRAAIDAVVLKHNLTVGATHITYSTAGFKFTGEYGCKDVMGDSDPILYRELVKHGWKFGLSIDDLGREISSQGRTFKIEGMKGAWVIGKNVIDQKMYKFKANTVLALLKE